MACITYWFKIPFILFEINKIKHKLILIKIRIFYTFERTIVKYNETQEEINTYILFIK